MSEQHKKNKRTIILIFAMSIIPFAIAWFMSSNTSWMAGGTNNGELINPPVTTEREELKPFDEFTVGNIKELSGHWVLVNVIPKQDCNEFCQEALHKTKQLRLMMNKDLTRIRRVVVLMTEVNAETAGEWWKEDTRLLRARPVETMVRKFKQIRPKGIPEGMLFLMDPLGNIMMQYEPGFDPYAVKRDLGKLLRISQIG